MGGEVLNKRYKVIPNIKDKNLLIIHPDTALSMGISNRKKTYICLGIKCCEVMIEISKEINSNEIILDHLSIEELLLSTFVEYEVIVNPNEIVIGPYIGILAYQTEKSLKDMINVFSNYVYDYREIGGVVLVFSVEGIQIEEKKIHGYLYNPLTKKWEEGVYSYPSSLFKRTGMNRSLRNHMHEVLGDKIFNDYIFDKWDMYQWLGQFPEIKKHLADSDIYININDLINYFNIYEKVYIKPINKSQGTGIIEIEKNKIRNNTLYKIKYMKNKKKQEVELNNTREVSNFLKLTLLKNKYIIQQGLELIETEDCKNDFRVLIVKNRFGNWEDFGMVVRHGVKGSIISNISGGGSAEISEDFFKNTLKLEEDKVYQLRKKMSTIAINAAKALEICGVKCGNLGIDMGIDNRDHIWIIEINNRDPNHTIAIDANDRQMFYSVKRENMLYAKHLAGF